MLSTQSLPSSTWMGETAAAGGVFMGLGLRGVRGSGVAGAVGATDGAPLEGGPEIAEGTLSHMWLGLAPASGAFSLKCV